MRPARTPASFQHPGRLVEYEAQTPGREEAFARDAMSPYQDDLFRADGLNRFDSFVRFMNDFRAHREQPVWYRICVLFLGIALVIGIFMLAGTIFHQLSNLPRDEASSVGVAGRLRKVLLPLLNRTLLKDDQGDEVETTIERPEPMTTTRAPANPEVTAVDVSKFEGVDLTNFFLSHDPRERICVVFPAMKPSTRFVNVVPLRGKPLLVGDFESSLFDRICDPSKVLT